jgi:hypothetical protein
MPERTMRGVVILVLALAVVAVRAPRAQDTVDQFEVQGWQGGARFDRTTQAFSQCTVSTVYGGIVLAFVLTPADEFRIEIGSDDWHLRPGGDYVTTLTVDRRESIQVIASARSDKRFAADFGADDEIIKALRDGQFLRVLAEHMGMSFSLAGSSQALQRLRDCVNDHRGRLR